MSTNNKQGRKEGRTEEREEGRNVRVNDGSVEKEAGGQTATAPASRFACCMALSDDGRIEFEMFSFLLKATPQSLFFFFLSAFDSSWGAWIEVDLLVEREGSCTEISFSTNYFFSFVFSRPSSPPSLGA